MHVSLPHYLAKIRMTNIPTILVEGQTDIYAIRKLVEKRMPDALAIRIDDAANLRDESLQGLGKRDLLEAVATKISSSQLSKDLIHILVDREFRETSPSGQPISHENPEIVDGSVYWTWGHSIENYLVDQSVCSKYFETELSASCAQLANKRLIASHQEMMNSTYALTKAIWREPRPTALVKTIGSRCFRYHSHSYLFDVDCWSAELRKQKHSDELVTRVTGNYQSFRESESPEPVAAQWYAHGHLAFRLQAGLIRCILTELESDYWEAKQIVGRREPELYLALVRAWATYNDDGTVKFPEALLKSVSRRLKDQSLFR